MLNKFIIRTIQEHIIGFQSNQFNELYIMQNLLPKFQKLKKYINIVDEPTNSKYTG